jgi:hypothetical protein
LSVQEEYKYNRMKVEIKTNIKRPSESPEKEMAEGKNFGNFKRKGAQVWELK